MKTVCRYLIIKALLGSSVVNAGKSDPFLFAQNDTIQRDVVIIGGGASGAHAAVRLRDLKKTVVVVEKESILGGHVDTYVDKKTGEIHDYGVQVYFPYEDSLDFISRFNLTLVPGISPRGETTTRYIDFSTGKELPNFEEPSSDATVNAVKKFHDIAIQKGYDVMTQPGYWNLPAGPQIPEDLLLPIGEFAKKYDFFPLLGRMWPSTGGGAGSRGNFSNIMTLTFMKSCPIAWVKVLTGEVGLFHLQNGNQELYDKIGTLLGDDVLYNSMVIESERSETGVKLVVQGRDTKKLIIAKRLLVAVEPSRENLKPFDLNEHETAIFAKPKYGRSHTGIVAHSKLPNGTVLRNMPSSALKDPQSPFLDTPFVLSFNHYGGNSRLFSVGVSGSDFNGFAVPEAQKLTQSVVQKMADAGTLPNLGNEPLEFVAWSDHSEGGFGVSPEEMRQGWMADLYALQGKRSTWFTGGGVAADFSPVLWKFNDGLFPKIIAGL